MCAQRRDVAAGDRAGQRRITQPQHVVQRGAEQRCEQARGLLHSRTVEHRQGVVHKRDEVVRADGERRVVQRTGRLRHPHRLAPHLDHERLRDRAQLVRRRDTERCPLDAVGVLRAPGERHDRVQREGEHAARRGGVEHVDALRARGVRDELPFPPGTGGGQPRHQRPQRVVRHREQHEVGGTDDLVGGQHGHARQHPVGAPPRLRGHRTDRDDLVARSRERRAERRPDPPGTDDTDTQPRGSRCAHGQRPRIVGQTRTQPTGADRFQE
jgi:hypothetical protein